MPIEYVPDYDDNGVDQGGHTESVPDMGPGKEEPDCHSCNDGGCPDCGHVDPQDPDHQKYLAEQIILARASQVAFIAAATESELNEAITGLPDVELTSLTAIGALVESAIVTVTVQWHDPDNPGPWSTEQPF
jgi:hypothetical protein